MNKDRAKDSFIAHIAEVVEKHGDAVLKKLKTKMKKLRSSDYAKYKERFTMYALLYTHNAICAVKYLKKDGI